MAESDSKRIVRTVLDGSRGEYWRVIKDDIDAQRQVFTNRMHIHKERGETSQDQYCAGVMRGLELALTTPERVIKKNSSTVESLKDYLAELFA